MKASSAKTVGVGGFGKAKLTTYKGKQAVVKYINTAGSPQATLATCTINRQDAKKEGEIMKLFDSPYIAEIYGIEGHAIYMKYYDQGSLRSQIDKGGADKERYRIAHQICRGLKVIHEINYVHSDIKASNILVEKFDDGGLSCFISDFGGARLKGTWPIAHTPGFSPANFYQKPLCFEDDIFSLGKLYLELFGKFEDYEIGKIHYNNYFSYVKYDMFTDNYKGRGDTDFIVSLGDLVRNCINEDSTKRPSLNQIENLLTRGMIEY